MVDDLYKLLGNYKKISFWCIVVGYVPRRLQVSLNNGYSQGPVANRNPRVHCPLQISDEPLL